jgi:hypothetical protein
MADSTIDDILKENVKRNAKMYAKFCPLSGEGSVGERKLVYIDDFPIKKQWLPVEMLRVPLVKKLIECGTVDALLRAIKEEEGISEGEKFDAEEYEACRLKVIEQFIRLRCRYDFPFWAALYVYIKAKGGGEDVLFRLTRPQRRFVERLERFRKAGMPIRLVLLKARQWGGSTVSQIYIAWLQLIHKVGLNSLIISHQSAASDEIKDMFDRMIKNYPVEMLHKLGESFNENEPKLAGVGKSGSIQRVPQRNCKIKIGTAERPDGCRGGDYNLVHLSEVGLWKVTDGKKPEDIVRSACSGVLFRPYTMIVYESTANGTGNFFQIEYDDAKNGRSQFEAIFISWFDIEQYSMPIVNIITFAEWLYANRNNEHVPSNREESGKYLWWLWELGATLEAINWYIHERAKYTEHGSIASEFPSDDVEAFVHSGARVFDRYKVENLRGTCRPPKYIGEVCADASKGENAVNNIRFVKDRQGLLHIWELPEGDNEEEIITNRYLTIVDIGGRGAKSDFSVILVLDRLFMAEGGKPVVVAQWYGHCDIDLLAWKSAQVAAFYNDSLLVIESNTLETHDRERQVDGDQSGYILNQIKGIYPNLYARKKSEEDIRAGLPSKYGFHTNSFTKPMIITTLIEAVREGSYIERDARCLDEYLCYEKKQNGAYGAIVGKHDDLLMTRAIGLHVCYNEMDMPKFVSRHGRFKVHKKRVISEATI